MAAFVKAGNRYINLDLVLLVEDIDKQTVAVHLAGYETAGVAGKKAVSMTKDDAAELLAAIQSRLRQS